MAEICVRTCLTQLHLMVYIWEGGGERERERERENFLHKDQLHVSALDNGHLQVEIEKLSKQLYWTYVGCIQWGGKR